MSQWPEHVRLRVVTDKVKCSNASVPQGEYDGYIDWHKAVDGEHHMTKVQLMLNSAALAKMRRPDDIPCEVLQYLKRGDIVRI